MATTNGYDQRWIDAINDVLADRDVPVQISDIDYGLWQSFIGPMIDCIEDHADKPRHQRSFVLKQDASLERVSPPTQIVIDGVVIAETRHVDLLTGGDS